MMERVDLLQKDTNTENLIYHLARYKFILRQCKPTSRVLEVGCGTGYGSFFISKHVESVTSVDVDKEPIEFAKTNYEGENRNYSNLNILDKPEWVEKNKGKYDVIICLEVIEHMERNQALKLMKLLNQMKTEDGIAYISTPRYLPMEQRTKNRQEHHTHEYTHSELKDDLAKVFKSSVILGQLDELIGSLNPSNVWNYFTINF